MQGRQWQPRLLFCLSLYMVFVSFTASMEASRPEWHLTHTTALGAGRYYYLPNFFLGLTLLMIAGTGSALHERLRRTALVLVAWMLVVGSNEFFRSDAAPLVLHRAGLEARGRRVASGRDARAGDLAGPLEDQPRTELHRTHLE